MSRSDGRAADEPFSWTAAGSRPKDKKHQVHKEPVHSGRSDRTCGLSTSAAGGVEVLSWGATGGHYESRD